MKNIIKYFKLKKLTRELEETQATLVSLIPILSTNKNYATCYEFCCCQEKVGELKKQINLLIAD